MRVLKHTNEFMPKVKIYMALFHKQNCKGRVKYTITLSIRTNLTLIDIQINLDKIIRYQKCSHSNSKAALQPPHSGRAELADLYRNLQLNKATLSSYQSVDPMAIVWCNSKGRDKYFATRHTAAPYFQSAKMLQMEVY